MICLYLCYILFAMKGKMTMKHKKIVFCINSLEKGGAERVLSVLSNNFSNNNDVYIITMAKGKIMYHFNDNIKIIQLSENEKKMQYSSKILYKINLVLKTIRRIKKLKNYLKSITPDIIISFLPEASFMTLLANNKKFKLIVSDRNDPNIEYSSKIYRFLVRNLYPKSDGFVFQTHDAKKYFDSFIDFNIKHYDIIYNPVDEKFLLENDPNFRNNVIVSVGRLTEQKNFSLLIDSFNKIKKDINDYKLIIYGEGPLRKTLEDKIKKYNLDNSVLLPGISNQIEKEIKNARMFVMSSNYEGMPNALIEAMCLGLPVISTDCPCGGPKMLIENGKNGFLVPVGDENELANKMLTIINDSNYSKKFSREAKKISSLVNQKYVTDRWKKVINEVIND